MTKKAMHKVILHIGRHKTGTSTLQSFLVNNREYLQSQGYYYPLPAKGIAHHQIADYFRRKVRSENTAVYENAKKAIDTFMAEIANINDAVLLSSEAFQNADPLLVGEVFKAEYTQVVLYLREQVSYAISSYQQAVHARNLSCSAEQYCQKFFLDYDKFLMQWESVLGRENVIVRIYDRAKLKGGDIVEDFGATIGLENISQMSRASIAPLGTNTSIGGVLLEFKRIINAANFDMGSHRGMLYNVLSQMAYENDEYRVKPYVSPEVKNEIISRCLDSNRRVCERHFSGVNVFEMNIQNISADQPSVTSSAFTAILAEIYRRNRGLAYGIVDDILSEGDRVERRSAQVVQQVIDKSLDGQMDVLLHNAIYGIASHNFWLDEPAWRGWA